MNCLEKALGLMPPHITKEIRALRQPEIEEIRIRLGRKVNVVLNGREYRLAGDVTNSADINRIIEIATGASYHMAEHSLNEGYINYRGLRLGVCGRINMHKDGSCSIGTVTSIAVRIPSERKGILDKLFKTVYSNGFESSLIISPPGGGKTTVLREMCRKISQSNMRVAVLDERNELLADDGCDGFDLGEHSDVLSCAPKALGSMMLLKTMNPVVIAMDEITKEQDIEAVKQINGCGVKVLATAHAKDQQDLMSRQLYKELLDMCVFKYLVRIEGQGSDRVYIAERIEA